MKITVFTSNQARHIALIEAMADIADEVFAVMECNTVFPGEVADFFKKSETMQKYFAHVIDSERAVFGAPRFLPDRVKSLSLKMGDLNRMPLEQLNGALDADLYVVFGASFIKGALCEHLVKHRAYNIHMGLSPFYRGNSCNFWALYDGRPDYVGATIHLLTKGLDSGPMLFHTFPAVKRHAPFTLGMEAVRSAIQGLKQSIEEGSLGALQTFDQDKSLQLRYTKNSHFDDAIAEAFLKRNICEEEIEKSLKEREMTPFLRPFILND